MPSQAPVPAYADFLARCPKPEAFAKVSQTDIETILADQTDKAAAYYGDLATLPLLQVCGGFVDSVCCLSMRKAMAHRGYNKEAGADKDIVALANEAKEWLQGIRDKEYQPFFVDSSLWVEDSGLLITAERSDDWVRRMRRRG